jgi:hypothetical protein
MAFATPTYSAAYSQAEQNANAVLIAAVVNQLITAAQKAQEAVAFFQRQTADSNTASIAAKTARDALP